MNLGHLFHDGHPAVGLERANEVDQIRAHALWAGEQHDGSRLTGQRFQPLGSCLLLPGQEAFEDKTVSAEP